MPTARRQVCLDNALLLCVSNSMRVLSASRDGVVLSAARLVPLFIASASLANRQS